MTKSVAIVTGAAGDIGRAIAKRLGDDHDIILLVDIDEAAVRRALEEQTVEARRQLMEAQ